MNLYISFSILLFVIILIKVIYIVIKYDSISNLENNLLKWLMIITIYSDIAYSICINSVIPLITIMGIKMIICFLSIVVTAICCYAKIKFDKFKIKIFKKRMF